LQSGDGYNNGPSTREAVIARLALFASRGNPAERFKICYHLQMSNTLPPLSLYIHLPWCIQKCPYCDFNSHSLRKELPEKAYLQALLRDLDHDAPLVENRTIISIFFGGGTPSLFSPESIAEILHQVQKKLLVSPTAEITLEANPGTFEQQKFAGFKHAGINRLSIGVQSFQADKLTKLGRIHDADQAIKAVEIAKQVGFKNINVDLMYGLAEQSYEDALFDVTTACSLSPSHISWYQLTLEPNTLYAIKPPVLPDGELIWQMQTQGARILADAGFIQYEVSAYAKADNECLHNLNYWEFGDYLGIGAGAHSKITVLDPFSVKRCWKYKHPRDYLAAEESFIAEQQIVVHKELPFEFMLNALRLKRSIPMDLFTTRTGLSFEMIKKPLKQAETRGFLRWNQQKIELTAHGWRFMNDLLHIFC